ncbi:MAG: Glu-tRNA(Gln) amidotransferase subunit GatE [candidate division Zixibacteria bacterium]|nr:Glu-tRNA(Gln) amidotransferase subunit GatE [candidate division Zixibacteria bacterium]
MKDVFDPTEYYEQTKKLVGYVPRKEAEEKTYAELGFKCGLEIHQQLMTAEKLFCRCPAGIYQDGDDFDAEVIRHMRPTLSEMGEYDGTALMERKTRKNIIYRIKNQTACTYEIDDTPPFPINREALNIAIEIALLLKTNIVGELHITRKQYLDGSIPTGFQRTAIVGIEGEIPLKNKKVRIIQLSIEEDACREVSDVGHWRVYTTDRLGMPLIETVTYPDMKTPNEAAEAGHYLRFLARSSGHVRTGIGAAREDVNVSITGGTRVEIKGVSHISWIPELTHNEAFRQKALLEIKKILNDRIKKPPDWKITHKELEFDSFPTSYQPLADAFAQNRKLVAVNLPRMAGILSFFTQLGQTFADEISGRLKVIACLDQPNMLYSEQNKPGINFEKIKKVLKADEDDVQILFWGPAEDVATALETIEERCRMAFEGIPNETRKSLPDGTTIFERVLPGPDRMYPDTDSAPLSIGQEMIDRQRENVPPEIFERFEQLKNWQVPEDSYPYLLRNNLIPMIEKIVGVSGLSHKYVSTFFGHTVKNIEGKRLPAMGFTYNKLYGMFKFIKEKKLNREIAKNMLPVIYDHPNMEFDSVLTTIDYKPHTKDEILSYLPVLKEKFRQINTSAHPNAALDWIMGNLRKLAIGNLPLYELKTLVEKELDND